MIDPILDADPGPEGPVPLPTPAELEPLRPVEDPETLPPTTGGQGFRSGPPFIDRLLTAKDFCAVPRLPPEFLCGPLLARGRRLVVAGETGAGKSSWSFQLLRAICHEEEFLGWKGGGGRGLILDFEQDEEDLSDLLTTLGLNDSDKIDVISIPHGVSLDKSADERAQLEDVFAAGGYSAVLLDPLYKVFGGDSSNERESVELMRHFDFWRAGAGGRWPKFGLVVPMHARKPPPKTKFTIAEIFGSTAWVRGAENVYGIQFINQGFSQLYAWKMRNHKPALEDDGPTLRRGDVMGMTFKPGEGFKRGATRKETAMEAARRLMSEHPHGWTVQGFIEAIPGKGGKGQASRSTIDRLLKDMGDDVRFEVGGEGEKVFWLVKPDPVVEVPDEADLDRWDSMAGVPTSEEEGDDG